MSSNSADVRFFSLDGEAEPYASLLSSEEMRRVERFRFDRDRNRFIICRGTLRQILGTMLDADPSTLQFTYGQFGKPRLVGSDVHFNVSHSHDVAMIAVTRGGEVGCDVECIDPQFAAGQIPERFFSPYEVATLRSLRAEQQCEAFFRCWTRKEAYIKACGMGVSLALDTFDVTLAPGQPAAILRGADGWKLHDVQAPEGYAAALVLNCPPAS